MLSHSERSPFAASLTGHRRCRTHNWRVI